MCGSLGAVRAVTAVVMTLGLLAILLAAMGLYGVVAYVMAGRTREFGIRLASLGAAAGVILGVGAVRLLSGMLGNSGSALPSAAGVGLLLAGVTIAACAIPARRATAISPTQALRSE